MKKKGLLTVMFFVLMLSLSLSASAIEINISDFNSKSTYTPVSYSDHKSVSEVTLYGNADYLCMKAFKDTSDSEGFWLNIYSDSKRTNRIMTYSGTYKKGTKYDNIFIDLTGLKSKTYYATSGVRKEHRYGYYKDDPDTITKFKITVKRDGTDIKKMKTFMYGYENNAAGPIIYWYSVPGATKYEVYRKRDGEWKKIDTVKALGLDLSCYVDESLKGKTVTAYYKVKAVNGTGKTPLSVNELKVNAVKAPVITLTANPKGGIKISWKKVADNATYFVYMATANSEWSQIAETTKTSYVYKDYMKPGTTYYFTVVAKTSKGTSGAAARKGILYFKNPEIKAIEEKDGKFVLSWSTVKGAQSYNVYRAVGGSEEWVKLGNTKSTSFTDKSEIKKNTLYTYYVKSVRDSVECVYSAPKKKKAIIDVPVLKGVKTNSKGYPVISWEPVENATYSVARKLEGATVWSSLGKTKSLSFTDKNNTTVKIENGDKYIYSVQACIDSERSEYSENPVSFVWYMPVKASLVPAQDCIGIKWEKAKNIDSYNIYRKSGDEAFALIGNTASEYYEDKTAVKDAKYTYKIVGVSDGAENEKTASQITAKLSSKYVTVSKNSYVDDIMYGSVRPSTYDSETKYFLYTKLDGEWKAVNSFKGAEGEIRFEKNTERCENVYAIGSVSPDGTVTCIGDKNDFALSYIVPTQATATPNHSNYTATLSWKPIDGAEKYNIYLSDEKIATVEATKTSYKTGKLAVGKYHYYAVGVVRGETEYIYDCEVYIIEKPAITLKTTAKGVAITWDTNEYYYTVYRKTSADGKWKALKKVSGHSYTDTKVENGKTYYYTVAAKGGAKNEKGTKITFVKPVTMSKAVLGKKSVELKWKKSSVADYYLVYKNIDGKWKKVYKTEDAKTVKYVDKDVKSGKKQSYRVYAVKNGTKSAYTSYSVVFVAQPAAVKATAVKDGVKLSFGKVSGAKKYVIYRKADGGEYEKIKSLDSSKLTYTDKKVKKGVKYTYYVKAYNGSLFGAASSKVSVKK